MTCKANNASLAHALLRDQPEKQNQWEVFYLSGYLLQGIVLHTYRSWLSRADIHRAGSQEREITSRLEPHKDKFGDKGMLQEPALLVLELNTHTWPKNQ